MLLHLSNSKLSMYSNLFVRYMCLLTRDQNCKNLMFYVKQVLMFYHL